MSTFAGERENWSTQRKTSRSKERTNFTQITYGAGSRNQSQTMLVGGGGGADHCTIPAPLDGGMSNIQ